MMLQKYKKKMVFFFIFKVFANNLLFINQKSFVDKKNIQSDLVQKNCVTLQKNKQ